MNLGCGLVAVLLAFILGAGALFVAMPSPDLTDVQAGAIVEAAPSP
jgi:hypothetical protein